MKFFFFQPIRNYKTQWKTYWKSNEKKRKVNSLEVYIDHFYKEGMSYGKVVSEENIKRQKHQRILCLMTNDKIKFTCMAFYQ